MKDYYKILEVNESASTDVINAAYKTLVKRYHPDLAKETERQMKEEKMKELNLAKDILTNPEKRSRYDIELKQEKEKRIQQEISERLKYAQYQASTKKNRNNQEKSKVHETPKRKETPISMVTDSFKSFFGLFSNFQKNKGLIIICSGLFLVAFLQIFLVLGYSFSNPFANKDVSTNATGISQVKNKELFKMKVGLSKDEVIKMFGTPNGEFSAYLKYGDAKILLQDNFVIGWIDTYEQLPIVRHSKVPNPNTLKTGASKDYIIQTFGTPDTYSRDLFVYDDVIIYFEKDVVTGIEYMKK